MSTALATQNSTSNLPAIDRGIDRLTDWCMAGAQRVGGRLVLVNWPSADERRTLQDRHRALVANLKSDPKRVATSVSELLASYRNALRPGEDAKKVTATYAKELANVPTWAVERTCAAIRRGDYPEHANFAPSCIALKILADSYVKRVHDEATRIFEVLHADRGAAPVSEADRATVGAGLRSLSTHLGGVVDTLRGQGDPRGAELAAKRQEVLANSRARRAAPAEAAE